MKNMRCFFLLPVLFPVFLFSCSSGPEKEVSKAEVSVKQADSSSFQPKSAYEELLRKFKPVSFDTLELNYQSGYGKKDKYYAGTELTLKEAKIFPLGITENFFGKISGVYACYQFPLDSVRTALIARIPGEYEANSLGLFIFDRKKDRLLKEYLHLSVTYGDAGDIYARTSWLIRAKNNQYQSFAYDYSSYDHQAEDTSDHTVEEWHEYYLFNCMTPTFDTLSKNEAQLKKRYKRLLKSVEY